MAPHSSTLAWKIPWTEEPGGLQSMGSLRVDTTERLHFHFSLSCIGEGNGNSLQCSCLENTRDGGAWWAAVYGPHRVGHEWSDLAAAAAEFKLGPEALGSWLHCSALVPAPLLVSRILFYFVKLYATSIFCMVDLFCLIVFFSLRSNWIFFPTSFLFFFFILLYQVYWHESLYKFPVYNLVLFDLHMLWNHYHKRVWLTSVISCRYHQKTKISPCDGNSWDLCS